MLVLMRNFRAANTRPGCFVSKERGPLEARDAHGFEILAKLLYLIRAHAASPEAVVAYLDLADETLARLAADARRIVEPEGLKG